MKMRFVTPLSRVWGANLRGLMAGCRRILYSELGSQI